MDSTQAIIESADDFLVQRVVGQIIFEPLAGEDPILVCMRIRVGLYDDNLDQAAFYATSLFTADGAEEPFLWQRYFVLSPALVPLEPVAHPWWTEVDVRVARRVPRDQALFLSLQASVFAQGGNNDVIFMPMLRSWARAL